MTIMETLKRLENEAWLRHKAQPDDDKLRQEWLALAYAEAVADERIDPSTEDER